MINRVLPKLKRLCRTKVHDPLIKTIVHFFEINNRSFLKRILAILLIWYGLGLEALIEPKCIVATSS